MQDNRNYPLHTHLSTYPASAWLASRKWNLLSELQFGNREISKTICKYFPEICFLLKNLNFACLQSANNSVRSNGPTEGNKAGFRTLLQRANIIYLVHIKIFKHRVSPLLLSSFDFL